MLNLLLSIFVGIEVVCAILFVCKKRSLYNMMNRNLNNDSYLCLGRLARELHDLACKDLDFESGLCITIYDLGEKMCGTTSISEQFRQAVAIYVNPNQTLESFIDTVLHETRHEYQAKAMPEMIFDKEYTSGLEDFDKYYEQEEEIDAREYALKSAKKYRRIIIKLVRQYHKQNSKFNK